MKDLKDPFTRITVMLAIGLVIFAYHHAFEDKYSGLQFYWIIGGFLRLLFWVVAIYPNYKWKSLNIFRQTIVVAIAVDFCLVFLPVDLLLTPLVVRIRNAINVIVLAGILLDDRDGGCGTKLPDEQEEKKKLAKMTTGNA
jgi:hypothetical protein